MKQQQGATILYQLQLGAYPMLEVLFFALSIMSLQSSLILSCGLLFLAAIFLNFSLHITYHYQVHFKWKVKPWNILVELFYSLLMGVPFQYYQMSHWNHHRYNNNLGDFTTTWQKKNGNAAPFNVFIYCLFWPIGFAGFYSQVKTAKKEGYIKSRNIFLMLVEEAVIICLATFLLLWNWQVFALYISLIYWGWFFIALHNYGQHLPEGYGKHKGYSYYNALYNRLFLYNGYHLEHHKYPGLKYWQLKADEEQAEIHHPHLIEGFYNHNEGNTMK